MAFSEIVNFSEPIPGASHKECGNYKEHNLDMAKYESSKYLQILNNIKEENLKYP